MELILLLSNCEEVSHLYPPAHLPGWHFISRWKLLEKNVADQIPLGEFELDSDFREGFY